MGSDLVMAAAIAVVGVLALVVIVVVLTRRGRNRANAEPPDEETTDHIRGKRRPTPRGVAPPPLAYVPQPALFQSPMPQVTPYLPPTSMADDGPTTADPTWQAKAEAHYARYRRFARGSSTAMNDQDEQRTALGVAPRPMQARPEGWDPAKSISLTVRSRNTK
jgi:hypothetical protein